MADLVLLSGENIELALGELDGVLGSFGMKDAIDYSDGRAVVLKFKTPEGSARRMGLCHFFGRLFALTEADRKAIDNSISDILDTVDANETVSLKVLSPSGKDDLSSNALFDSFCRKAKEKGLTLHHRGAVKRFFLLIFEKAYLGTIVESSERAVSKERRGSKMPFNRPIVMEPKIAKAMVNLSGLENGSLLLDPFLGPAGLAIEASHMGMKVIGIERDPEIIKGAIMNIEAQGLGAAIECHMGDSRSMSDMDWWNRIEKVDGIVTDPPFGRSAPLMGEEPGRLLKDVLSIASQKMESGAPLVLDTDTRGFLDDLVDFNVRRVFPFRVHKSLTRYIGLLIRN